MLIISTVAFAEILYISASSARCLRDSDLIDYGFDPFSSIVYSILEIFGASTRDDHRDRQSVDIGELESIDTHDLISIDSEGRRKPVWYMPSSTRSNKETQLLFSPIPASLERSIRKEARSLSTDNNTSLSLDSAQPPSTDSRSPLLTDNTNLPSTDIIHPTSIDIPSRISIDTDPRDMVAPLILVRDNNGDLHDQEGHLRNAAGSGNKGGNRNSYGNRNNFNQNSQYQKPYNNSYNNNMNFGSFYYQKAPPRTQESRIEDRFCLHQPEHKEASTRGVGDDVVKHHVNAIIEDDFLQVVKEEKLQEGDFEEESLMSFGGSHWYRSTPDTEHRSIYTNTNRSTGTPEHRSTTPTESTASCNAVKILTHEEFAAK
ncbi:hypothetical protein F2Q69_00006921 [Brassica cretica]|uniref:Uncharacterized protein n=1 Tax=Brassica cretica TaxID=69181 RepID=A0A8S9P5G7_BRACR|nr:hypothetical protein F2Q69_00006921 [Brassica cretica]